MPVCPEILAMLEDAAHERICLSCWLDMIAEWLDSNLRLRLYLFFYCSSAVSKLKLFFGLEVAIKGYWPTMICPPNWGVTPEHFKLYARIVLVMISQSEVWLQLKRVETIHQKNRSVPWAMLWYGVLAYSFPWSIKGNLLQQFEINLWYPIACVNWIPCSPQSLSKLGHRACCNPDNSEPAERCEHKNFSVSMRVTGVSLGIAMAHQW